MFNIVLVHPEIPQNTGNIGRLTAGCNGTLHLIEPLGFSIEDKLVRRAGLDYWPFMNLSVHASWSSFLEQEIPERLFFFTTKAQSSYVDIRYAAGDYLVFGSEGSGLPAHLHERYAGDRYTIPMKNENVRSLNLANAVAVVTYEGLRQLG